MATLDLEPVEAALPPEPPMSSSAAEPSPVALPPKPPASPLPSATESPASPPPAELPLSELEFTGCKAVPMTYDQLRRYDGRLEVWDAESETAWMVREPTSPTHESPSHGLAGLVERIAAVRGSSIKCYGSMDLLRRDARGEPRRIMQADQTVYLYPRRAELLGASAMVVGRHNYPDVVLEVDHTTDVRRGKLKLYESWGFPEVWVEVPERWVASRPRGLVAGLTIHLLEDGVYRESPESVAFPGWRAEAIHEAMNEAERSVRTNERLERLGRVLGLREGTGPDDDALLRSLRGGLQCLHGRRADIDHHPSGPGCSPADEPSAAAVYGCLCGGGVAPGRADTPTGRERYAQRKWLSEAPNGWIKEVLGFRRFSVPGLNKAQGEWDLVCLALNIKRLQPLLVM